jgi:TolB-like protein
MGRDTSMTESAKAVFLSYASQDAEAAQRICAALRAADIEVWFDQSELRGGDAWDRKIRTQIRDSALFLPLVSEVTAERPEGYFRLEWSLAEQRAQMIARGTPFVIPILLGNAPKSQDLPDEFRRVQWMTWRADPDSAPLAQRVRTLLDAGAKVSRPNLDTPVALQSRDPSCAWALATLTGVAVMASLSWAVWQHARGMSRLATAAPSGVDSAFSHSVAVLPFVDMSALQDQGYFGDGLTEELIDLLSRGSDLRVPARTSSFFFKGKQVPLTDVARALSVAYILEGSVRKSGDTMRVTAQLVRANDGYHVWSDSYDRELRDVFKVQDEIAAAVVAALRAKLSAQRDVASGTTRSPEAYEQYLIARDLIRQTGLGNYKRALSAYQRALELDPDFAGALIGAADANYLLIVGQGPISKEQLSGVVRSPQRFRMGIPHVASICSKQAATSSWRRRTYAKHCFWLPRLASISAGTARCSCAAAMCREGSSTHSGRLNLTRSTSLAGTIWRTRS